jgi:hypothetical protein
MQAITPYRAQAYVPAPNALVKSGRLKGPGPKYLEHRCNLPHDVNRPLTFWERLTAAVPRDTYEDGDFWRCGMCGQVYRWEERETNRHTKLGVECENYNAPCHSFCRHWRCASLQDWLDAGGLE